jgi:hypothetical protein
MKNNPVLKGYNNILEHLRDKYYQNFTRHSNVTSSYWRTIGHQSVKKKNNEYVIDGFGFGDYRSNNIINNIRAFFMSFFSYYLLKKYQCPKYLIAAGKHVAAKSGHDLSFDSIKQILSINMILKNVGGKGDFTSNGIYTVCVIGDGYAFLSNFIKFIDPKIKVISINLGRTLFFDVMYSKLCHPTLDSVLLNHDENKNKIQTDSEIMFIEAENFNLLEGMQVDLFINIASMQEMDPKVTQEYFEYIRSSTKKPCYFYCCNRSHKKLPDGTVTEFKNYPWKVSDEILLNEPCPWYQKYPSLKPPFWHKFDSPIEHKLVQIN